MFKFVRNIQRSSMARRPFPKAWEPLVEKHLSAWYTPLSEEEKSRVREHLKVFAWEKYFIGAGGLEVTDEMRVVVAGQAARLSRNLGLDAYDRLTEVILYPSHYRHPGKDHMVVYGEAHYWGTMVLSWDAVKKGLRNPRDGRDTTLHEFAHVLDVADGVFDGTPRLHKPRHYRRWATVFSHHYERLLEAPDDGVVRAYGAQNAAEFFAVATEAYFEQPQRLRREARHLYEELHRFYSGEKVTRT